MGYLSEKTKHSVPGYIGSCRQESRMCPEGRHPRETPASQRSMETVRKIRKLGVENAAEILSTRDKSAALVLICCFNMKEGHYKRKRPTSGLYHCHNSVYSEEIYNSSEIVGKETKPGFSRYL